MTRARGLVIACAVLPAVLSTACASSTSKVSTASGVGVSTGTTADWRSLFDGRSLAGWRRYRSGDIPSGWHVVDGTLVRDGPGGDIITADTFANFELMLEWKIAPGGNSGIMYRVTEDAEAPYETGPEMQVLDDERHADGRSRLTSAGSLYGLYPAPPGVVKPAGEWNSARIVVNGNHVEHWLNGTKTVDAAIGSDDWNQRVASSKFRRWPGFGKAKRGHIALQDHGDWVAYRNIQIRVLP
jgi:3-keto-disaccharide hydrolase